MPIKVRFRIRPPKKGESHGEFSYLQVRIEVDSECIVGAIWGNQKLIVETSRWRVAGQKSTRRDDPVNAQITALKAHIEAIFYNQQKAGFVPTSRSVEYELSTGSRPRWTEEGWYFPGRKNASKTKSLTADLSPDLSIEDAYHTYIRFLRSRQGKPGGLSKITLGRWDRGLLLLKLYAQHTGEPLPTCGRISVGWCKRLHGYLQSLPVGEYTVGGVECDVKKPISVEQASRFLGKVGEVLSWMIEEDVPIENPVAKVKWKRGADKEVYYLTPDEVTKLLQTEWRGTKGAALWWFCLMCCTGLDYPDAVQYVRDRASMERMGIAGVKLVGRRSKPPYNHFDVPLLPEVLMLFAIHPNGAPDYSSACINRYTDQIEDLLGFKQRITIKIARKTFGALMIHRGYRIEEVSRMLGHKSIKTTERYYVRILGDAVDRGMLRVMAA